MNVFFTPAQRSMKVLSESQTIETLEHVRILLTTLPEEETTETVQEHRAKNQRTSFDECVDDDDNSVVVDEITVYQNTRVGQITKGIFNLTYALI